MSDEFVNNTIEHTIGVEGEYSDHPSDRGGPTRWGITERVAREFGYTGDMRELPRDSAFTIYKKQYYYAPGFDKIALMSQVIAEELFDSGVNFGPTPPIIWLQRWLNVMNRKANDYPDFEIDGVIGLKTIGALRAYLNRRGSEGEMILLTALNCSQAHRYLELAEGREANEDFIYGWLRTRVFTDKEKK